MADLTQPSSAARSTNASIFVATLAGIVVLVGILLSFDLFLARIDRRESDAHAADEYATGVALLREGRASDAAEHFGTAVAIERSNVNYSLALAEAMLEEGRTSDAESTLRTLLERAENDGAVNLTMAHVVLRQGRAEEAKAYFHRAIFGRWGADSLVRRTQARFELIELLERHGAAGELLAELLPFEETSPDSVALRRRLGKLFIAAGSPTRAANMFREVLRHDPDDAEAYAGMGEAALALGNFRTARADFAQGARARPDNALIAARLALADTLLALDPTARGIGSNERLARSRSLLGRTIAVLMSCGAAAPVSTPALDSARALLAPERLAASGRGRDADAETEAVIGATVDLWATRPARCTAVARDEALSLLVSRITQ